MKMFSVKWLNAAMLLSSVSAQYSGREWTLAPLRGQQCFQCSQGLCEKPTIRQCPDDKPFCATMATYPNFTSSLTCAVHWTWRPCSLVFSREGIAAFTGKLTCTCTSSMCNSPFTTELREELIKFSSEHLHTNDSELMPEFWLRSRFAEFGAEDLYGNITEGLRRDREVAILEDSDESSEKHARRSERSPSDDEEEEGEGSGLSEEGARPALPSAQPPAPAAPGAAVTITTLHFTLVARLFLMATVL